MSGNNFFFQQRYYLLDKEMAKGQKLRNKPSPGDQNSISSNKSKTSGGAGAPHRDGSIEKTGFGENIVAKDPPATSIPALRQIQNTGETYRPPLGSITNKAQAAPRNGQNVHTRTGEPQQPRYIQQSVGTSLESKLSHIVKVLDRESERMLTSGRIKNRQRVVFKRVFEEVSEAAEMMNQLQTPMTPAQDKLVNKVRTLMRQVGVLLREYGDVDLNKENVPPVQEVAN
ncbi:hypothetical protein PFICI_07211 [Pestalotiopsis fici W106-1]|uniref:Uncharacterized protein n=1 Tax=Pestalotiopsis fici (strain W106-1 / CGMCC3.15140) TaxID=1229662 RepID=W3X852_PESFW|nr:uncharacterized protein PFICI_07211 [Pestalotiopsis fici W106-1]ETS82209.1 hypothetical protein PFICI_07211 [Pestalotiopsis fici W106-1]